MLKITVQQHYAPFHISKSKINGIKIVKYIGKKLKILNKLNNKKICLYMFSIVLAIFRPTLGQIHASIKMVYYLKLLTNHLKKPKKLTFLK